ncbi:hypothetical protein NDU88_002571 [Pleurodeles waltl]|uniref:Uncharacterized protein n=1 Tax=Pleurodeles waltl TaxID=8319 RepID=A0AAV7UVZ9_PLEWA|nr:hypothetical protein NDU88_002571 [Pleurodeles waltl]
MEAKCLKTSASAAQKPRAERKRCEERKRMPQRPFKHGDKDMDNVGINKLFSGSGPRFCMHGAGEAGDG